MNLCMKQMKFTKAERYIFLKQTLFMKKIKGRKIDKEGRY